MRATPGGPSRQCRPLASWVGRMLEHDSQVSLAHYIISILSCGKAASDVRSPHTARHTVLNVGGMRHRQP